MTKVSAKAKRHKVRNREKARRRRKAGARRHKAKQPPRSSGDQTICDSTISEEASHNAPSGNDDSDNAEHVLVEEDPPGLGLSDAASDIEEDASAEDLDVGGNTIPNLDDVRIAEDAPGEALSDIADLQRIETHRLTASGEVELLSVFPKDTKFWIREYVVQRAYNAAVCTYWAQEQERRPDVPSQLLNIIYTDSQSGRSRVQMVGDPLFDSNAVRDELEKDLKKYKLFLNIKEVYMYQADEHGSKEGERHDEVLQSASSHSPELHDDLQFIFSHRKTSSGKFELFCWRTSRGAWEPEEMLEADNSAALETYWGSEPGLREVQNKTLGKEHLRITSHEQHGGELYLTVEAGEQVMVKKAKGLAGTKVWKPMVEEYFGKNDLEV